MRLIKSEAQAYTDLAAAYTSKKQQDLPNAIEKHQGQFVEVRSSASSVPAGKHAQVTGLQRHIKLRRAQHCL